MARFFLLCIVDRKEDEEEENKCLNNINLRNDFNLITKFQ